MKTLSEKIAVMQAFERGEVVETTPHNVGDWFPTRDPVWNWVAYDYRIAAKPKRKVKLLAMVYRHPSPGVIYELNYSTAEREDFIRLPQFDVEVEVDDE